MFFKRAVILIITRIQGFPSYRKIARLICSGIEIKEADEQAIKEFYACVNPDAKNLLYNPNVSNFVAKKGRKSVGFTQLIRYHGNETLYPGYWLFSLVVKFLYRGMGIGEKLTQSVIKRARGENAKELSVLVREDNPGAIRLYTKLGFVRNIIPFLEEKLKQEKFAGAYRRIVMTKIL